MNSNKSSAKNQVSIILFNNRIILFNNAVIL